MFECSGVKLAAGSSPLGFPNHAAQIIQAPQSRSILCLGNSSETDDGNARRAEGAGLKGSEVGFEIHKITL